MLDALHTILFYVVITVICAPVVMWIGLIILFAVMEKMKCNLKNNKDNNFDIF